MYIAVPASDLKALDADEALPALLQAEAAFVGRTGTFVVLSCEHAPDGELWEACGLSVATHAGSRDQIERWIGNATAAEALQGVAEAAEAEGEGPEEVEGEPATVDTSATSSPEQPAEEEDEDSGSGWL